MLHREPCAYFEGGQCTSLLTRHSWAVREVSLLAADRLVGAPHGLPSRDDLILALEAASVYHDMGKASRAYQEARSSFPLHEHVGAAVLARAAELALMQGLDGCARILAVAAGAVARHHAAMEGRHPRSVRDSRRGAVSEIAARLRETPPGTATLLAHGIIASLVEEALAQLQGSSHLEQEIEGLLVQVLDPRGPNGEPLLTDTIMVTGALIVGDILAASLERRGEVYKSYAKSWLSELELDEDELRALVEKAARPTLHCRRSQ